MLDIMNWKCLKVHSLSVRMIFINPRKRCEVHIIHPDSVAFLGCHLAPVNIFFPGLGKPVYQTELLLKLTS